MNDKDFDNKIKDETINDSAYDIFVSAGYNIRINYPNVIDGLSLLGFIKSNAIKVCFFDPEYRGVMDKLSYGNEGARQIERALLPQMSDDTIMSFVKEIDRVLQSSGYLFLWIDKFHLCQGVSSWLFGTNLEIVDMIVWDKLKMGMGYRTRKQCEYMLIIQKKPILAKATWTSHSIRDIYSQKIENRKHPHEKPSGLIDLLIKSTTKENDFILDPCAGSYNVFEVAKDNKRNFIGCDLLERKVSAKRKKETKDKKKGD